MYVSNKDPVLQLLREGIRKGIFPGAALCVSRRGSVRYDHALGKAMLEPNEIPLVTSALFDVASLTKPIVTTTAIMLLIGAGEIELDHPVSRFIPSFRRKDKEGITIRHLLSHSSGLPAHLPFYEELEALRAKGEGPEKGAESIRWVVERIAELEIGPIGQKAVYSDLGFMVLGHLVELVSQQSLDQFSQEHIFQPLGMEDTFFLPLYDEELRRERMKGRQIVATEKCPWRKKVLLGEVHDDNCYSLGGVAGHAGLFSTTADIHRFASTLLRCSKGVGTFLPPELIQEFWTIQDTVEGSTFALGWDTPSPEGSQAGDLFSKNSVGHLGFTGCSLWIDRDQEVIIILLTNRVHPTRENDEIRRLRPLVHNTIRRLIEDSVPLAPPNSELEALTEWLEESAEALSSDDSKKPLLYPPTAPKKDS